MIHVDIISYRKLSFARKFGFTVRDLMILKSLIGSNDISTINWLERPDTILEVFDKRPPSLEQYTKLNAPRVTDWNLLGALRHGRAWAATSFFQHQELSKPTSAQSPRIVLDFSPFFIPSIEYLKGASYWYDVIDNFLLHNRFSPRQLDAVARKYRFVKENANFITGVTAKSLSPFGRGEVVPNQLIRSDWLEHDNMIDKPYDFGFIGFITDKFDIKLLRSLSERGYKTHIAGQSYDNKVLNEIKGTPGVTYSGPFNSSQARDLLATFNVGLIPYLREKLHDESPIKFFQYICAGLPVIMSTSFNKIELNFSKFIHYYNIENIDLLCDFYENIRLNYSETSNSIRHLASIQKNMFWDDSIALHANSALNARVSSLDCR